MVDAAGNDLSKVFVPVTGALGYGPEGTAVPARSVLGAASYTLPGTVRKVGLVKQDGGFEWSGEPDSPIEFWQEGYILASGLVTGTLAVTLAQTDPIVRELIWGKAPDEFGVIDVELGSNTNVYWLYTEEVAKNLTIRRRIAPNCAIQSVKEDKSERGSVQGYAVTFRTQRSPLIGNAHFREAVIAPTAGGTKTAWNVTVTGAPTGGTYALVINGAETAPIAYNAAAAAITSALNALSGVTGISGISTSGSGPFAVTLPSNALLEVGTLALTGGTTPGVTVS